MGKNHNPRVYLFFVFLLITLIPGVFACSVDSECQATEFCNAETCISKIADGMTCTRNEMCISDNCLDEICRSASCEAEICNNLDDDCDGSVDEDLGQTTCGLGVCLHTVDNCENGETQTCDPFAGNITEIPRCDGLDNDCDGEVDDGVLITFYQDLDGDKYGNNSITTLACYAPTGYQSSSGDCDDNNAAINPGATETCNNVDDDCDGEADDNYIPNNSCFLPGICASGNVASSCTAGTETACSTGTPALEVCNGLDDDCNGAIDNGVLNTYYKDNDNDEYGIDKRLLACSTPLGYATSLGDCNDNNAAIHPGATEICDGVDDDCDETVDEDYLSTQTTCGLGECAATGETTCVFGVEGDTCVAGIPTGSDDNCNGLDEDCDGQVDEDYAPTPFTCGIGACASTGESQCIDGQEINTCTPGQPTGEDDNCNDIDENCDGTSDNTYISTSTTCGIGACVAQGQKDCVNGKEVDSCTVENPTGLDNNCNNIDENCNGIADDAYISTSTTCGVGICASTGESQCIDGQEINTCTPETPTAETCNNLDDDCDGQFDEELTQSTNEIGACSVNTETCSAGSWIPNNEYAPVPETCNNLDDNCDGDVDEGVQLIFYKDSDGDGYGDVIKTTQACSAPTGYVSNSKDLCPLENSAGFDANLDGCIDTLAGLKQLINNFPNKAVPTNIKKIFTSEINSVSTLMSKGKNRLAVAALKVFVIEVKILRDRKISKEAADMIIAYTNNVIAKIRV